MSLESLDRVLYGNTVKEYLVAALTFIVVSGGFLLARRVIVGRLKWLAEKTETKADDLVVELLEMIRKPECYLVAFYMATRPLTMPAWADKGFRAAVIMTLAYRAARMLQRLAKFAVIEGLLRGQQKDAAYHHTTAAVSYLSNAMIWSLAVVFTLDNLGFSVASIVTGLGIGGIAVALAAQAVLGDVFAAIAIYLDRPFVVGDFISFGDNRGTVLEIGFKTTAIKSLSGERLIMPNSLLASQLIRNWTHLQERRVEQVYSVAYGTPREKLATLAAKIRELIIEAGQGQVRVDRVHLKALAAFSYDIEAVYFVLSGDYNIHMDIQHRLNLGVLALLEREGIEIPFPTKTIHLAKEPQK